ncbi:MAG TPA: hypothetical protein VFV52_14050 [Bacilli bacterium]|nr:hypothetical protein [Bacilli bacterium]
MSQGIEHKPDILAIVTTDDKQIKNGKATMIVCDDETEQKKIMQEMALALRADVVRLSNGMYLLVR